MSKEKNVKPFLIHNELQTKLAEMRLIDNELRPLILGYVAWMEPVTKGDIYAYLRQYIYNAEQIYSNLERLRTEKLLLNRGGLWRINSDTLKNKKTREQVMKHLASSALGLFCDSVKLAEKIMVRMSNSTEDINAYCHPRKSDNCTAKNNCPFTLPPAMRRDFDKLTRSEFNDKYEGVRLI